MDQNQTFTFTGEGKVVTTRRTFQFRKRKEDGELVSVFEAIHNGGLVILKVFDLGQQYHGATVSTRARREILALRELTRRGCEHSPHLITTFVPDDIEGRCVVMTRCPGESLASRGDIFDDSEAYNEIQEGFTRAIRAVHAAGVENNSNCARNIVWDDRNGKCYIVDFERAKLLFDPDTEDFSNWTHDIE